MSVDIAMEGRLSFAAIYFLSCATPISRKRSMPALGSKSARSTIWRTSIWPFSICGLGNRWPIPGGQEKTKDEFARLFAASGFRLTRVIEAGPRMSIIEGEPA
ncbi:hypothetical protein [Aminobacter aminovorans]|uniref:hypothetical protein n=1 Tax=Aminobacter aminovorans TaxID=83263 RepID=UPI0014045347|nr:hypothetical protein [Aminobacter aminovorans]